MTKNQNQNQNQKPGNQNRDTGRRHQVGERPLRLLRLGAVMKMTDLSLEHQNTRTRTRTARGRDDHTSTDLA